MRLASWVPARTISREPSSPLSRLNWLTGKSDNTQVFTRRNITCASSTLPIDPATGGRPCNVADTVNTIFPTATSFSDVTSKNFAVFGQATYRFTEQLSLTGGLRYTWDDLEFTHTRAPPSCASHSRVPPHAPLCSAGVASLSVARVP